MLPAASAKCCPRALPDQRCWFLVNNVLLPTPKICSFWFSGDEKTVGLQGKDQLSHLGRWGLAMSLSASPLQQAAREAQELWLQNEGYYALVLSANNTKQVVSPPTDSSLQQRVMTPEASRGQQHPAEKSRTDLCLTYAEWEKNHNCPQWSKSFHVHN